MRCNWQAENAPCALQFERASSAQLQFSSEPKTLHLKALGNLHPLDDSRRGNTLLFLQKPRDSVGTSLPSLSFSNTRFLPARSQAHFAARSVRFRTL